MLTSLKFLVVLGLSLSQNLVNGFETWNCKQKVGKAKYDLCPLQLSKQAVWPYYEVYDNNSIAQVRNFSYVFNVAASVMKLPKYSICYDNVQRAAAGFPIGYCPEHASVNETGLCSMPLVPIKNATAAYQIPHHTKGNACWRLHDGLTEPSWELLDTSDPSLGMVLTYKHGDFCGVQGGAGHRNRELRLHFECTDRANNYPDKEEEVVEDPACVYTVKIKSIHGCPTGCKVINGKLCNGQGICDWDWTHEMGHCFCYDGYYGSDCSDTEDPNHTTHYKNDDSGYITALVVIIILLVITAGILVYLWMKLNNVSLDPRGVLEREVGLSTRNRGDSRLLTGDPVADTRQQIVPPL